MTPNQLATKLAGAPNAERIGKAFVRPLLRRHFTRDATAKGSSWNLTDEQIKVVTLAWKAKQAGKSYDVDALRKQARKRVTKAKVEPTPAPSPADVA